MKPDEQRIAIAKACGWGDWNMTFQKIENGKLFVHRNKVSGWVEVPDYLTDLNAMHDAEKMIADKPLQVLEYYRNLVDLLERAPDGSHIYGVCMYWETLHASAALRAEAFLRTLNLWTNE